MSTLSSISNTSLEPLVFVGHRGFPQRYPENSAVGIKAALELGALAIEIDVQASADGEPMVCHDPDLERVAGLSGRVDALTAKQLQKISVHEPRRFNQQFNPCPMSHLTDIIELVASYEGAVLFVELKEEVFTRISRAVFIEKIRPLLAPLHGRVFVISFDLECLRLVQAEHIAPVGWVISHYDAATLGKIEREPVDVVISDVRKLPPATEVLWQGPWQWFIYDVVDPESLAAWQQRGIRYIETWDIQTLLDARGGRS
jgi:glycerophosphoryl diester phosphodiesterase